MTALGMESARPGMLGIPEFAVQSLQALLMVLRATVGVQAQKKLQKRTAQSA